MGKTERNIAHRQPFVLDQHRFGRAMPYSYVVVPTRILLRSDADFIPCTDGDIGEIDTAQEGTAGFAEEISTCGE